MSEKAACVAILLLPFALTLIQAMMPPVEDMLESLGVSVVVAFFAYLSIATTIFFEMPNCTCGNASALALVGAAGTLVGFLYPLVLSALTGIEDFKGLAIPGGVFVALKLALQAGMATDFAKFPRTGAIGAWCAIGAVLGIVIVVLAVLGVTGTYLLFWAVGHFQITFDDIKKSGTTLSMGIWPCLTVDEETRAQIRARSSFEG